MDLTKPYLDLSKPAGFVDTALLRELTTSLAQNTHVTALDLSHNPITSEGADLLCSLLLVNPHIQVLKLTHCELDDSSANTILRGAKRHSSLRSINFSANPMGNGFGFELARFLPSTHVLEELVLLDTKISFDGCVPLIRAMVQNTSLLYCSLPFSLGYEILTEVKKIVARNWDQKEAIHASVAPPPPPPPPIPQPSASMENVTMSNTATERLKGSRWDPRAASHATAGKSSFGLDIVQSPRLASLHVEPPDTWSDPLVQHHLCLLHLLDRKTSLETALKKNRAAAKASITPSVTSPRKTVSTSMSKITTPRDNSPRTSRNAAGVSTLPSLFR